MRQGFQGENIKWHIEKMPFFWGPINTSSNPNELPDFLPFTIGINRDTHLISQICNDEVVKNLEKAYRYGSMISGLMDGQGIGKQYANDFLKFLNKTVKSDQFYGLRILEIGCGNGYLLSCLKKLGAEVIGIEPGQHGTIGASKYNVTIINDFFPSEQVKGKFDLIIMYGVLEHINLVDEFLAQVENYLDDNGKMIISVPDCEAYIKHGDISMLLHEHYHYFTRESLLKTITNTMKYNTITEKAGFGGAIYCCVNSGSLDVNSANEQDDLSIYDFIYIAKQNIDVMKKFFMDNQSEKIAIYVPQRAINFLTLIEDDVDFFNIRFIDDNILLHGTYFPGFQIPVQSRIQLMHDKVDIILIASFTFGERIANEIKFIFPDVRIVTISSLLKSE